MEGITPKNSSLAIIVCTRLLAVINSVYAEWMDGYGSIMLFRSLQVVFPGSRSKPPMTVTSQKKETIKIFLFEMYFEQNN